MSHGSSGDKCEPNLVPMLDMVLQLVMFFMVCANFVMENVNQTIRLPEAIAAKPMEKAEEYFIFLNVNNKGQVLLSDIDAVGDDKVLSNAAQVKRYMERRAAEDYRAVGGDKSKPPRSTVVLRVDKETPFVRSEGSDQPGVYDIMKAVRAAGYERVQLRAIIFGGETS